MTSSVIIDLYKWMPHYGEDRVSVIHDKGDLCIDVEYSGENDEVLSKRITFDFCSFYSVGSFPGIDCMSFDYDFKLDFGALSQIENSELARVWTKYWKNAGFENVTCNHYIIVFGNANKIIHVVASDCSVI